MNPDKLVEMQHLIRENSSDIQSYINDLTNWEKEMKMKEKEIVKQGSFASPESVEKASVPEREIQLKKKRNATDLKEFGNVQFKEGNYLKAIECYTLAMMKDTKNAVLPANRAMAYIKIEKFDLAETDCSASIALDATYVKAYLRRGSARKRLKRFNDAEADFRKVLELEPKNKEAFVALNDVQKEKGESSATAEAKNSCKQTKRQTLDIDDRLSHLGKGILNLAGSSEVKQSKLQAPEDGTGDDYSDSAIINPVNKEFSLRSEKPLLTLKVKNVNASIEVLGDKSGRAISPAYGAGCPDKPAAAAAAAVNIKPTVSTPKLLLPPVPKKSYQFAADWRKIESSSELQYQYLKQFPAKEFSHLFTYSMESELLGEILKVMAQHFIVNNDDVFTYMEALSKINRFKTLMMLLSEEDVSYVKDLLHFVGQSNQYSDEEKAKLSKTYGC